MHSLLFFVGHYGYPAIFLILAIESLGVPSPSEFSLLLAGYLVDKHQLAFWPVVLAAAAGSTAGAGVAYWVGLKGGRPFLDRYGRYLSLPPPRLEAVERWFGRHGWKVVYVGRVVSGIRLYVSYPAGAFGMNLPSFIIPTVAGALTWPLLAVPAGMYLGDNWRLFLGWAQALGWLSAVVVLLVAAVLLCLHKRSRKIFG